MKDVIPIQDYQVKNAYKESSKARMFYGGAKSRERRHHKEYTQMKYLPYNSHEPHNGALGLDH